MTQRQATVCASFMVFMGCNCGLGFTRAAESLCAIDSGGPYRLRAHAFLMAWAIENRRHCGINRNLRTIEAMLARDLWIYDPPYPPSVRFEALDEITTDDYDTVECMVEWWAGEEAKNMREIAEPLIHAAYRKASSGLFTQAKEGKS
ncbi:hypothetical protein [Ottowia thiooxydans]|uniref:Uncharacterized protein n=1 Tax=Ottowia thiooxydans TaxID=219182 RepID=A0ABV2Q2P0_9BURK